MTRKQKKDLISKAGKAISRINETTLHGKRISPNDARQAQDVLWELRKQYAAEVGVDPLTGKDEVDSHA